MHSLEQPLNTDGDSKSLEDMLEDDGPSMNELVVHGGLISDVNNLLHTLSPREQGVLRLRYGLDGQGERTLDDIGRFFKVISRTSHHEVRLTICQGLGVLLACLLSQTLL